MTVSIDAKPLWPAAKVRDTFIEFFKSKDHVFYESSACIPHDDPTLLFANSGMCQFKPIFLGTVDRSSAMSKLKRAANTQKCIRAGGKHNDLEDVGRDVYHHTFFEMLGNWSFGDYFKKEAIAYAWELLTSVFGLDKSRLYVTYFGGDEKQGLEADLEAKQLWIEIGVPPSHVLPFGPKENFWEMGDQGPCGPCSEIHYDRIGGRDASKLVNMDDPDVIEIWNLVFIQFNREPDSSLLPLPNKNVDTGMGFERVVSVLQDKRSNYDTDVFMPIFRAIEVITGARPYSGKVGSEDVDGVDTAYRVIADHVRTLTFAISDGGVPSNEGRGYVLRRILRRGARYARRRFNVELGTFFATLADTVVLEMGPFFPEITRKIGDLKEILEEEERSFAKTLDRGEKLFETYLQKSLSQQVKFLDGADAFKLYDTFGFPIDLTRLMALERGVEIDEQEFERQKQIAREKSSKKKFAENVEVVALDVHRLDELEKSIKAVKTDDKFKYQDGNVSSKVLAILASNKFVKAVDADTFENRLGLILDRTNFYGEQGGQVGDTGLIAIDGVADFVVEDVQIFGGYVLHIGYLKYGAISVADTVICSFDEERRWTLRHNHSATHVLNLALRQILGSIVDQKGSLVAPDKLRFDFSAKEAPTSSELISIEQICSDFISRNLPVHFKEVPLAQAKQIRGLRAVFGEVYPDPVRVVVIGETVDRLLADLNNPEWEKVSIEFCGGTHVQKTGDIKQFCVVEESSIAKGIRRIVAVTGETALNHFRNAKRLEERLDRVTSLSFAEQEAELKVLNRLVDSESIPLVRRASLKEKFVKLRKGFANREKERQQEAVNETMANIKQYFESKPTSQSVVYNVPVGGNVKALTAVMKQVQGLTNKAAVLVSVDGSSDRVFMQSYVPKPLQEKGLNAVEWLQTVSELVNGKHGGKPEASQGSGTDAKKVDEALKAAEAFASMKLS